MLPPLTQDCTHKPVTGRWPRLPDLFSPVTRFLLEVRAIRHLLGLRPNQGCGMLVFHKEVDHACGRTSQPGGTPAADPSAERHSSVAAPAGSPVGPPRPDRPPDQPTLKRLSPATAALGASVQPAGIGRSGGSSPGRQPTPPQRCARAADPGPPGPAGGRSTSRPATGRGSAGLDSAAVWCPLQPAGALQLAAPAGLQLPDAPSTAPQGRSGRPGGF